MAELVYSDRYQELLEVIRTYDSDTFCAKAENLTEEEVRGIAEHLLEYMITTEMDGQWLSNVLENIRELESNREFEE